MTVSEIYGDFIYLVRTDFSPKLSLTNLSIITQIVSKDGRK